MIGSSYLAITGWFSLRWRVPACYRIFGLSLAIPTKKWLYIRLHFWVRTTQMQQPSKYWKSFYWYSSNYEERSPSKIAISTGVHDIKLELVSHDTDDASQYRSTVANVRAESTAAFRNPGVRPRQTADCTIAASELAFHRID